MGISIRTLVKKVSNIPMRLKVKSFRLLSKVRAFFMRRYRDYKRNNNYSMSKRLLIYTIYESENQLQEYKLLFLKGLLPLVSSVKIIVNGELPQSDIENLKSFGNVVQRENIGYDAGAFRFGILSFSFEELQEYDQLLLVNDTNIGPLYDLSKIFIQMDSTRLDFWGMSFGEAQPDFTGQNPYGYIYKHLQSYFLVIEKSLLSSKNFYSYWEKLSDTNSRDAAIGKHETVFTHYFSNRGYVYDAVLKDGTDSPLYLHPLRALKNGLPLIKYSALDNFDDDQFLWQNLVRKSEVPDLLAYIELETTYPVSILENIVKKFRENSTVKKQILIIDGVENIIPQCTRYRVFHKAEQLEKQGFEVKVVNASSFILSDAKQACAVIIYRALPSESLNNLVNVFNKLGRKVFYDIDDLVFDIKYTDQLEYTQKLSKQEKKAYDYSVNQYGEMLSKCDSVITSTEQLRNELNNYSSEVIINRNVLSKELVKLSKKAISYKTNCDKVRIAYFSGSITHNENFEIIKSDIIKLLSNYDYIELHLVGYLDIPMELSKFSQRIVVHPYVDWKKLPFLIANIDINLAPLKFSVFNDSKSEIKWLEAAAVKVVTVASNIGGFKEMIVDGKTGVLVEDNQWYEKLEDLVLDKKYRASLAEEAYQFILENCTTDSSILNLEL